MQHTHDHSMGTYTEEQVERVAVVLTLEAELKVEAVDEDEHPLL